jgi:hypothetical protein
MRRRWARLNASLARKHIWEVSTSYLVIPTTKQHMNNDALIIGFIFEPKDEGIRFWLAIKWLTWICWKNAAMYPYVKSYSTPQ